MVTEATTTVTGLRIGAVVGSTVTEVEPRGKHLLIRFSDGNVLHTHMRMTGSWHVYPAGERWRRPAWQARLVLTCGDRVAVCFNAPVIELLRPGDEAIHRPLAGLGPDVLDPSFDADAAVRRARSSPAKTVGELLLDQRVASGVGNIYRCESLFLEGLDPWTAPSSLDDVRLAQLMTTASRLMKANVAAGTTTSRQFGGGGPWVYGRAGRPCRRCGSMVRGSRLGEQARVLFWCPRCQAPSPGPG